MDATTVARRLGGIEQSMGASLFERGRSGIHPTEMMHELLPIAEEMEHAAARFEGTAEAYENSISGLVRLTCPPDAAEVLIVPLLPVLAERHPQLRLQIDATESLVDLARRAADLALRVVRPTEGDLVVQPLKQIRWCPAASPEQVGAWGPIERWGDVPWIGCGESLEASSVGRWQQASIEGFDPVLRSDSIRVQAAAAALGLGAVLLPEPSVEAFGLRPLEVSERLEDELSSCPAERLYLVAHRALRPIPRVRAVWELLAQTLG